MSGNRETRGKGAKGEERGFLPCRAPLVHPASLAASDV